MKTISMLAVGFALSLTVFAQTTSTVTVNIRGANNQSVVIDGKEYTVTSDYNSNNSPIVISSLAAGQHTLQIKRNDNLDLSSTVFTVRNGYDLTITVAANGSVQLRETKWRNDNTGQYMVAMSESDYNNLYNTIRNEWRTSRRMTLISNAFATTSNYFTTAQAKQLIQLINNQSNRFTLAKASYARIVDPTSFTSIYELFNSQAYRTQLQDYVASYNAGSSSTAMSNANFTTIFRTARRQSTTNSKVSYIYNAFTNTSNYFSVNQAKQLIQLVPDEVNRLQLAKVSYRSVVDKSNFSQIISLLNSQSSRNELTTFVNNYDPNNPVYTRIAMKEADFNALYQGIQNRFGIGVKMSALMDVFDNENYFFTTAQAKQLIQLVSSDDNRLQLAKLSYDNIVDQANFSQLFDILSSSGRAEIESFVRNYDGSSSTSSTVRIPMSENSYNTLYNRVRNTWGIGAKMAALTDIFDNESNLFTVSQAKQLISLVSSENNRLQLAKAAYANVTDTENYNLMHDLLSSQNSRNELSNYVNSYSLNR